MTKKERVLMGVVFVLFTGFVIATLVMVVKYLKLKVGKFEVEQQLQQARDMLELSRVELKNREKKISELREQITKFRDKVSQLQKQISTIEEEKRSLKETLDDTKTQMSELQILLDKKDRQIAKLNKKVKDMLSQLTNAKRKLKVMEEKLEAQVGGFSSSPEEVSLGRVVVSSGDKGLIYDKPILGRVLSLNAKYNFAIIAVPRGMDPPVGQRVKVVLPSGDSFVSVVDTARKNMMSMDVPAGVNLSIGDAVEVWFLTPSGEVLLGKL